jgi:hypothetical protein
MAEQKHRYDFTDVLIWGGIIVTTLWAIGKSLGLISSPEWVNMVPIFGILGTISGISFQIGRAIQKLDRVITDVENHGTRIHSLEQTIANQ